jgi:hypothetical protein
MKTIFKATVEIFVEVEDVGEACDAVAESLRDHLPGFSEHPTCWVDWQHLNSAEPVLATHQEIASLEAHED